jgi:lipopolysaccharide transport system ATP-binding protein
VRLAFAVAAHLQPEIMIVDEVLAVGDAAFQKKCLGKMNEVAASGRTVLFVSHNMGAIRSLTSRTVWLQDGCIKEVGPSEKVVGNYLVGATFDSSKGYFDATHIEKNRLRHGKYSGRLKLRSIQLKNSQSEASGVFVEGSRVRVELEVEALESFDAMDVILRVRTMEQQLLFTCLPGSLEKRIEPGMHRAAIRFELGQLMPGVFQGDVVLFSQIPQDGIQSAFQFEIVPDSSRRRIPHGFVWHLGRCVECFLIRNLAGFFALGRI